MLAVVLALAISVVAVARPPSATVREADAVAVHAANDARLSAALALVEQGVAPVLVVSDAGDTYGRSDAEFAALCERREPYEVICARPDPSTTIGEARMFGRLADERGWARLAVVTDRWHLARAGIAVGQCTDATVLPVAARPQARPSASHLPQEWLAAVATRTMRRAC